MRCSRLVAVLASTTLLMTAALVLGAASSASRAASGATATDPVANAKPFVVPTLQTWTGGYGSTTLAVGSRIVMSPADTPALTRVADALRTDIADVTGLPAPKVVTTTTPGATDIVIDLDPSMTVGPNNDVARNEGYRLTTSAGVHITAPTAKGVYWGTRTMLQVLTESPTRRTLPVGTTADWPNFPQRGFMLDVGRRYFTPQFLRDYVKYMSWYKYNTFQVHLNDNEISPANGDWSQAYSAFRLASDNPRFAGLAAKDGSYTRADWDSIEDTAAAHFVTIEPEIDGPAHARAFIAFDPSLGMNGGNSETLDLSKPATTQFMKDVFTEFTPWFRGRTVHFGADEYPQEYALDYRDYFNAIAAHIRSLGKHPAAWGSFTWMSGTGATYDPDVTISAWSTTWYPLEQGLAEGREMVNNTDKLYIVPFASYYNGQGLNGRWIYDSWDPGYINSTSPHLPPGTPHLLGAMSSVWNDLVHATYTELDVHHLVKPTFGVLAQKMWRGTEPDQTYDDFMARVTGLGVGPGPTTLD